MKQGDTMDEEIKNVKKKIEDLQELYNMINSSNRINIQQKIFSLQDRLEELLIERDQVC